MIDVGYHKLTLRHYQLRSFSTYITPRWHRRAAQTISWTPYLAFKWYILCRFFSYHNLPAGACYWHSTQRKLQNHCRLCTMHSITLSSTCSVNYISIHVHIRPSGPAGQRASECLPGVGEWVWESLERLTRVEKSWLMMAGHWALQTKHRTVSRWTKLKVTVSL